MLWSLLFILLIGACGCSQGRKKCTCKCSQGERICPENGKPTCLQGKPTCLQEFPFSQPESNWSLSQSSMDNGGNEAKKAVDGDKTSCAKTKREENSWWMIDLQGVYDISSIAIYNKNNDEDIRGAQIYIGNCSANNGLINKLVTNITNFQKGCWNVYQTDTSGRYITVSHPGKEDFSLCEVRINATKKDEPTCPNSGVCRCPDGRSPGQCSDDFPFNPSDSWITSQSSNFEHGDVIYNSTRAIDGNKTACAHTKTKGNSWWMIDLLGVYDISSIAIYNIVQHNTDMTGARIHIGYSCKNNSIDNELVTNITNFQKDCWNVYQMNTSGRYITVFDPEIKHVVLCEVRINATKKESPFKLIKQRMTWENALEYCRANHRDLASILDEEDQAWAELEAKQADTDYVWLGLHYTCVLEFWFWVADHCLDFHHWAPGEKKEECDISVAMNKTEDHQWFSKSVYDKFNFLCEK